MSAPATAAPVRELIRPVRGRILAGSALAFAGSALGLLPYAAIAEIARLLLQGGGTAAVWTWAAAGAGGVAARLGLLVTAGLITHYADADLQRLLRLRLARHLATVPLGWFSGRGSGALKKAMDDDIEDMHHLVAHAALDMAGALGLPLAAVVYLAAVDWRMTLVTLALLPIATITIGRSHRTMPERMAELNAAQQRINNAVVEYVDGIQVVKAYGSRDRRHARFAEAVDDFCDTLARWTAEAGRAMFATLAILSPPAVLLVVAGTGTALVAAGALDPVDLLPFLLVGVGLPAPFMTLLQGTQLLRKAQAAAAHVGRVLAEPPLPAPAAPTRPGHSGVDFADVTFAYGGDPVLRGVSFSCPAGTTTALVGPSGSGKSTLLRLVPRFFDPSGGAVRIGGADVRDIDPAALLRSVAIVFQDAILVRDTVRENIRLGDPDAGDADVEAAARAAHLHDAITALPDGYDTVVEARGGALSGGERQRLTIARALLQDAPIVLLDEATAHVDPENETAVRDSLSRLTAGRTVIVIAHRLHTVAAADRIVVLEAGRVRESGTHRELLASDGAYARAWHFQHGTETVR
ncbi:ABC transporter ATP-binding protein [Glycomyces terrestris]|uniref:ABC transporter ATP-binding protein n=1 Tax=Glycomyces terrestris TaxID=2493553 RepID=A0A426V333_9ACTN|nr:ABC transporter ATP-binding protein [Glycomyces terrestris]RRS01267.1 ABC transporter ATP-binding protein [Glycomyces terrestris]